jgi:hypothetical protein
MKRGAARLRGPRGEEMMIPQSLYAVLKDLLAHQRKRDEVAQKALGRLVAEAQDLGIYDE